MHPFTKMQCADFAYQGYLEGGHPELFRDLDHFYFSTGQAGTYGNLSLIDSEEPGAVVALGGHFWYLMMPIWAECAARGIYSVGGDQFDDDNAVSAVGADYCVFAEEMIAAAAYVSNDPVDTSILVGEDIYKLVMMFALPVLMILYMLKII